LYRLRCPYKGPTDDFSYVPTRIFQEFFNFTKEEFFMNLSIGETVPSTAKWSDSDYVLSRDYSGIEKGTPVQLAVYDGETYLVNGEDDSVILHIGTEERGKLFELIEEDDSSLYAKDLDSLDTCVGQVPTYGGLTEWKTADGQLHSVLGSTKAIQIF
jgi:hypothetical protein